MRTHHRFAVLTFAVSASIHAGPWAGRAAFAEAVGPERQRQIVREFTAGLDQVEGRFATGRIIGTWTTESKIGQPSHKFEVATVVLERIQNKEMKYTRTSPPDKAKPDEVIERVAATDGQTYFLLDRRASSADYAIKSVSSAAKKDKLDLSILRGFWLVNTPTRYASISTKDLINDPGFTIDNVAEFTEGEDKLFKIDFSLNAKAKTDAITSGSITVMPQEQWMVREFVANMGGKLKGFSNPLTVQYRRDPGGVLLPKTFVDLRGTDTKHTFEVEGISFEAPPKRIFTLQSYGFPDLNAPATKGRTDGVSVLLFSLASVALLGAVVVAVRAGRRRAVANG